MSDYISRQEAIDRLSEVLSSEAEFERAKQVIIEAPTVDETEIIRKTVERIVTRLEEKENKYANAKLEFKGTMTEKSYEDRLDSIRYAIEIVKSRWD